jgi:hypothetical protein
VLAVDLDELNNIVGARRNYSDELPTARSFSPKFLDDNSLLYISETGGERVLVLVDLRTGGKQKISPISGSIDTVARYTIEGKNALFFGLNKEIRRYDLPTGPLRSVVANSGSVSGQAYEKMGIFENTLVFSVQATPKERAFAHMRLDGTELKAVMEAPPELVFPIIKLARDPGSRVQRFNLFDFTRATRSRRRRSPNGTCSGSFAPSPIRIGSTRCTKRRDWRTSGRALIPAPYTWPRRGTRSSGTIPRIRKSGESRWTTWGPTRSIFRRA